MGYSSGMLDKRVIIQNRKKAETSSYGLDGTGIGWEDTICVWASVSWAKGMRSMNVGALDAYGMVLVRMRWNCHVTTRSRISYDGQVYQILPETFHADKKANTVQFNAQLVVE